MAPNTPAPGTPDTKAPHRLFVGGLTKPVAPDQLRARFTPFGTVLAVDIPQPASQTPDVPRGFAHVTLETNRAGLKRCMSTYNGTKWAGMVLKIDEAKPSYLDRLKEEWKEAEKGVVEKPKKRKRKRRDAMVANDMTLVSLLRLVINFS